MSDYYENPNLNTEQEFSKTHAHRECVVFCWRCNKELYVCDVCGRYITSKYIYCNGKFHICGTCINLKKRIVSLPIGRIGMVLSTHNKGKKRMAKVFFLGMEKLYPEKDLEDVVI